MTNGFSSAVSRLFRAFHRGDDHRDPAAGSGSEDETATSGSSASSTSSASSATSASLLLLAAATGRSPPKHTRLPSGFTRHVRHLVDYVSLLAKLRAAPSGASASATARRHAAAAKALDRVAQLLRAREDNDQAATRAVPLNAALEQLLAVWECVLQCIDLSRAASSNPAAPSPTTERLSTCSSTSSTSGDDAMRLETAARRLLAQLVQLREFDLALMALGRGECNVHQHDGARKRSIHDGGCRPDELRVSMRQSRRSSVAAMNKRPPVPRPLPSKRDVSKTSDAALCVLSKKYLDLHQTTLRLLQDAHEAAGDRFDDRAASRDTISDRALLMQLLTVSYVRVPALRDAILASFQKSAEATNGRRRRLQARELRRTRTASTAATTTVVRGRSVTLLDAVNVALFRWTQNLNSKCHGGVAPYNRDGFWSREARHVAREMQNPKFQRVLLAQLIEHFMAIGGNAGIDWKCLPGATVLKEVVLSMTERVFVAQLRAAEQSQLEKQDADGRGEGSSLKSDPDLGRQSFSLSTADDWTVGLFLKHTMRVLKCNPLFIHDWMMTILHNTNYMVSYQVTLCLRYLSQLLAEFPAYFADDCSASATVLLRVFSQLLKSDHFEILRNTELFLMKHFHAFSVTLRESLVAVFAGEFKRLFLHWNRDVRFCFYHMLLYLTYPGNRLVLGATSDELLMGAAAAYLFEIPGLARKSAAARQWDAFDAPLCELITHVNRSTKNTSQRSLAVASASAHGASMGAMLKPRGRAEPSSTTTTRASMTLRPKPSARASLSARPSQYGRGSLAAAPASTGRVNFSKSAGPGATAGMPKCASMSALPVAATQPPPPPPAWIQALPRGAAQRSVQEYRRHVETYFSFARQISIHEPVPTPMLQTASKA